MINVNEEFRTKLFNKGAAKTLAFTKFTGLACKPPRIPITAMTTATKHKNECALHIFTLAAKGFKRGGKKTTA
ncbi:hypothetical protein D3C87_1710930 [compost metagenome]